jgi:acyl-CoA thioesterase I
MRRLVATVTRAAVTRTAVIFAALTFAAVMLAGAPASVAASDRPLQIVAFGDSLTAGYGLPAGAAFPAKLQQALAAKGIAAEVANAGVSGDTTSGGLERLDWSVPDGTEAVILELGANDALRGVDPKLTRRALEAMLERLKARHIPVLLAGMLAPRNLGSDYAAAFDAIYPDLAKKYGAILYPFFLDGVAADPKLNQRDGLHPTAAGVDAIVAKILPDVERLAAAAKAARSP